jgi:hypothetical protein
MFDATALPSKFTVIPFSLTAKPKPLTVIEVPGEPLCLLSEMPAPAVKTLSDTSVALEVGPFASMI